MRGKTLRILMAAVVVALAVAAAALVPTFSPPIQQISVESVRLLACSAGDAHLGTTSVTLTDGREFLANPLGQGQGEPTLLTTFDKTTSPIVAQGSSMLGGYSAYTEGSSTAMAPCSSPLTYGAWNGVSLQDQTATLIMTNVDATAAVVDVLLYNQAGPVPVPGLTGITVPAGATQMLPVDTLTESATPITVVLRASTGRVMALMRLQGNQGIDWEVPQTTPSPTLVMTGIPAGNGSRLLSITNTSAARVSVTVALLQEPDEDGPSEVTPLGDQAVDVGINAVVTIDLTQGMGAMAGAVLLRSTGDITAAMTVVESDQAVVTATLPMGGVSAFPGLPSATLWMSNPSAVSETVSMQTDDGEGNRASVDITVPGSSVVSVPFPDRGRAVLIPPTVTNVHASVIVTGSGLSILPLLSGGVAMSVDAPRIDPALG